MAKKPPFDWDKLNRERKAKKAEDEAADRAARDKADRTATFLESLVDPPKPEGPALEDLRRANGRPLFVGLTKTEPKPPVPDWKHIWMTGPRLGPYGPDFYCKKCGMMQRRDGLNGKCPGSIRSDR